jgi:hypothetical protein
MTGHVDRPYRLNVSDLALGGAFGLDHGGPLEP